MLIMKLGKRPRNTYSRRSDGSRIAEPAYRDRDNRASYRERNSLKMPPKTGISKS